MSSLSDPNPSSGPDTQMFRKCGRHAQSTRGTAGSHLIGVRLKQSAHLPIFSRDLPYLALSSFQPLKSSIRVISLAKASPVKISRRGGKISKETVTVASSLGVTEG